MRNRWGFSGGSPAFLFRTKAKQRERQVQTTCCRVIPAAFAFALVTEVNERRCKGLSLGLLSHPLMALPSGLLSSGVKGGRLACRIFYRG